MNEMMELILLLIIMFEVGKFRCKLTIGNTKYIIIKTNFVMFDSKDFILPLLYTNKPHANPLL